MNASGWLKADKKEHDSGDMDDLRQQDVKDMQAICRNGERNDRNGVTMTVADKVPIVGSFHIRQFRRVLLPQGQATGGKKFLDQTPPLEMMPTDGNGSPKHHFADAERKPKAI